MSGDDVTTETSDEVKPDAVVETQPPEPPAKPKRTRATKPAPPAPAQISPARASDEDGEGDEGGQYAMRSISVPPPAELPKRKYVVCLKPHDKAFPPTEVEAVTPADAREEYKRQMGIVRTEREIVVREP